MLEVIKNRTDDLVEIMKVYTDIMDKFVSFMVIPAFDNFNTNIITNAGSELLINNEELARDIIKGNIYVAEEKAKRRKNSGMQ